MISAACGCVLSNLDQDQFELPDLERHVNAGVELLDNLVPLGGDIIREGDDSVSVSAGLADVEEATPSIVVNEGHLGEEDLIRALLPIFKMCRDLVVAVLEDVGPDLEDVPDFALYGESAAIDLWPDVKNEYAGRWIGLIRQRWSVCWQVLQLSHAV